MLALGESRPRSGCPSVGARSRSQQKGATVRELAEIDRATAGAYERQHQAQLAVAWLGVNGIEATIQENPNSYEVRTTYHDASRALELLLFHREPRQVAV